MTDFGSAVRPLPGDILSAASLAGLGHEPVRVLVIDAEQGMREGLRRILDRRGCIVRTTADGESALRLLAESPSEVALVPLSLPGMEGSALTEQIIRRFGGRTVVVITSARTSVEAAVEVTRQGAFDFLARPSSPENLICVVERAAQQGRMVREREKYLSELAGERNLSRQMINSMHEGVVVLNIRREPVLMNPRAEHFLGTHFRDGMSLSDLFPDLDTAAAIEAVIDSASERPECRLVQLNGGQRRLQGSVSPLLRNGEAGGAIVILSDVTDTWKAEQDKNMFVSMVAHELKSPLSAIINYLNVILTGMFDDNPAKVRGMLERCKVRGEALLDLVRDLLYINSREVGKVERTIEPLDLKGVIASQLEFFKVKADARGIHMQLDAPQGPCMVKADRGDLDRIFMNLISNGIRYNRDKGSLSVRITAAGPAWEIAVVDTGIGMSDAEQAGIFQEFYRVKNHKTSGIAGTGLGLATVRRVLAGYNGRAAVQSRPDAGSTFTVTFPREG
ncbi:MAG: ATP-binding protein [Spirochaetia bacterium]|jgi:signal transduction histidine kinase/FixJ family two-component response regulator